MLRLFLAAISALLAAQANAEPLRIHAVNAPLAYFAERLAGDDAEVTMPVPAGTDPASWRPDIAAIAAMQEADLILLNGAELYGWTQRVSLPRARVVDTIRDFPEGSLIAVEAITHSHGDEPEHSHGATATETWLDFRLAALQAAAVAEAIVRLRPGEAAEVEARQAALEAELSALEALAAEAGALLAGAPILAMTRGYEYLARQLGVELVTLSWNPGASSALANVAEIDAALAINPSCMILIPAPLGSQTVKQLAGRGVYPVVFDTGATTAGSDLLESIGTGLEAIRVTLAKHPCRQTF